jgi:hypothetical protein
VSLAAPRRAGFGARLLAVLLFAAAMGWLEAVVVVYIRGLLGFGPGHQVPVAGEFLPRLAALPWLLPTEQGREAATIVMLATVGWLAGVGRRSRIGAFLVAFGVWDIVYYVGLFILLRWPPSLGTPDLLFLLPPTPLWVQPVWVPLAVSAVMIAAGIGWMRRENRPPSGN